MSKTLNPIDVLNDKPVIEKPESVEQSTENQTDDLKSQNDTNSTANEVSPLKRDSSEMTADDQTPAKKKSKRIDKFKQESEALLRSFGLKEGTDSEKRLTRSRTRGTPVSTPVAKPEPKKVTTGAKRGRKPASEKKLADVATPIKPTPQKKGRGRARKQEEEPTEAVIDNNEDETAVTEESEPIANDGDKLDQNEVEKSVEPEVESKSNEKSTKTLEIPTLVVTKEETKPTNDTKSVESDKVETSPIVQKEEIKVTSNDESSKLVEKPNEKNLSIPSIELLKEVKKPNTEQIVSKVENNIAAPAKNETNDQVNKTVPAEVDQTKPIVESKLETDSIEKQEVQTA